jgi:hypothetical protein
VGLAVPGSEKVDDFVPAGVEELRDQPAVALPPEGLGAHEARGGVGKGAREGVLPFSRRHPRGVAAEAGNADAREPRLAGLAAPPPAKLDGVPVADPGSLHRRCESAVVELRMPPRAGKPADVDERAHPGFDEADEQLVGAPGAVTDREDAARKLEASLAQRS